MITEKTITKNSQDYAKFKALYRKAFPRKERVPIRFLMNKDMDVMMQKFFADFIQHLLLGILRIFFSLPLMIRTGGVDMVQPYLNLSHTVMLRTELF